MSFNGRERPIPVLDERLINALEQWMHFRIEKKWGVRGDPVRLGALVERIY